jgi:hypothetical protein
VNVRLGQKPLGEPLELENNGWKWARSSYNRSKLLSWLDALLSLIRRQLAYIYSQEAKGLENEDVGL